MALWLFFLFALTTTIYAQGMEDEILVESLRSTMFRARDPSTYNFTEDQTSKFREARSLTSNGTSTVFSSTLKFKNGQVKLYFDALNQFKRIQMSLEGPYYTINIYSYDVIDEFFRELEGCFRPHHLCTHCSREVYGQCHRVTQWTTNWLASLCFEPKPPGTQFNGILLMNVLHVSCKEIQMLRALSNLRLASEWL